VDAVYWKVSTSKNVIEIKLLINYYYLKLEVNHKVMSMLYCYCMRSEEDRACNWGTCDEQQNDIRVCIIMKKMCMWMKEGTDQIYCTKNS
jgi:hypothetical protein